MRTNHVLASLLSLALVAACTEGGLSGLSDMTSPEQIESAHSNNDRIEATDVNQDHWATQRIGPPPTRFPLTLRLPENGTPTPGSEPGCSAPVLNPSLDPFYCRGIDVGGILVVSSSNVDSAALEEAQMVVMGMLEFRPDIRAMLVSLGAKVAVIGQHEVTTDIPEYRALRGTKTRDGRDYDTGTRGLGGLTASAAEENLLRLPSDRYKGEDILTHEFAHTIYNYGLSSDERAAWKTIYSDSIEAGRWTNTYAAVNGDEFFAELTQSYLGVNQNPQPNLHNEVNGVERLRTYDVKAAAFLELVYGPR